MSEGVAEYRPAGKDSHRVFVSNDVINKMNPTFAGRPVFVGHRPDANPEDVKVANGAVVESFFNKHDGNHWAKFLVFDNDGVEAIKKGLVLSNCYTITSAGAGGRSKGVDYEKEVLNGEFHHMAIVQDPRYENSVILTPEEFKEYNAKKETELVRLANSKKGEKSMFNLFKREKVENSAELEQMSVLLPKSKKEKTLTQLINEMDENELKKSEPQMANGEHHVMVGEEKMTVNELVDRHMKACNELAEMKKAKVEPSEEEKKANEAKEAEEKAKKEADEKKANEDKEAKEKEEKEKAEKEKVGNSLYFDELAKADKIQNENDTLELGMDQFARGKSRYGSGK